MKPGIHTITADEYHADPAEQPSLSASIARILVNQSPAHARAAHPRLNPNYRKVEAEKYDIGTGAHALLLEGADKLVQVDAPDWRTKDAKEQRDRARELGLIPLLAHQCDDVHAMIHAAASRLIHIAASPPVLLGAGAAEQTLIWQEDDAWCRARLDWLHDDHTAIDDYKTTSRSANPHQWSRTLFNSGYDIQAAFYLRGLKALTGADAVHRWVVQETYPPYALAIFQLAPDALALAEAKVDYAIRTWQTCMEKDEWRAYPLQVCHAQVPPWDEAGWLERLEQVA